MCLVWGWARFSCCMDRKHSVISGVKGSLLYLRGVGLGWWSRRRRMYWNTALRVELVRRSAWLGHVCTPLYLNKETPAAPWTPRKNVGFVTTIQQSASNFPIQSFRTQMCFAVCFRPSFDPESSACEFSDFLSDVKSAGRKKGNGTSIKSPVKCPAGFYAEHPRGWKKECGVNACVWRRRKGLKILSASAVLYNNGPTTGSWCFLQRRWQNDTAWLWLTYICGFAVTMLMIIYQSIEKQNSQWL